MADFVKGADWKQLPADPTEEVRAEFERIRNGTGKTRAGELRAAMQQSMMDNVGVFREEEGMQHRYR